MGAWHLNILPSFPTAYSWTPNQLWLRMIMMRSGTTIYLGSDPSQASDTFQRELDLLRKLWGCQSERTKMRQLLGNLCAAFYRTGLRSSVVRASSRYPSEYGYTRVEKEFGGVQYTVRLEHCKVCFWRYKNDLGSSIRPISSVTGVRYASQQVDEVSLAGRSVSAEVERQVQLILKDYGSVLKGDFEGWPIESA
jgi:hypothetical protein